MKDPSNEKPFFDKNTSKSRQSLESENNNSFSQVDASDLVDLSSLLNTVFRRKKLIGKTILSVISLVVLQTCYQRFFNPIYTSSISILTKDPIDNKASGTSGIGLNNSSPLSSLNLGGAGSRYETNTLIEYLTSEVVLTPISKKYDIDLSGKVYIRPLIKDWSGGKIRNVIKVNANDKSPAKVRVILDILGEEYVNIALEKRKRKINDGLDFIYKQIPIVKGNIDEAQQELASFRIKNKIVSPIAETANYKLQISSIEKEIRNKETSINGLNQIKKELKSGRVNIIEFNNRFPADGNIGFNYVDDDSDLLKNLRDVQSQLAEAKSYLKIDSPRVVSLQSKIDQLKPLLINNQLESIEVTSALLEDQIRNLYSLRDKLELKFEKQPLLIKEYELAISKLKLLNSSYLNLLKSKEEYKLLLSKEKSPWKVITNSNRITIINPSIKRNIFNGIIGGVILGILLAFLKDKISNKYYSSDEVQEDIKEPILGDIPYYKSLAKIKEADIDPLNIVDFNQVVVKNDFKLNKENHTRHIFSEAYKNLAGNVISIVEDNNLRSIALTSSVLFEGKNTLSVIISKIIADSGKRVLLIDTDVLNPKIHSKLNLNNRCGFSNIINDNINWRTAIQKTPGCKNLSVITAGEEKYKDSNLLNYSILLSLKKDINDSSDYEIIIFNTSPIMSSIDSMLISKLANGLILTVGLNFVDRSIPIKSLNKIYSKDIPVLGIITNSLGEMKNFNRDDFSSQIFSEFNFSQFTNKINNKYLKLKDLIINRITSFLNKNKN